MCDHTRVIELYLKHNDLTDIKIKHLDIDIDGEYVPHIGNLGGDDTNLDICLDCGQVLDWEPITDEEILQDDTIERHLEKTAARREREQERKTGKATPMDPAIAAIPVVIRRNKIVAILTEHFGPEWTKNPDAKECVEGDIRTETNGHELAALYDIMEEFTV